MICGFLCYGFSHLLFSKNLCIVNRENSQEHEVPETDDSLYIEVSHKCEDSTFSKAKDILKNSVS